MNEEGSGQWAVGSREIPAPRLEFLLPTAYCLYTLITGP
jgi:hypothetical protein